MISKDTLFASPEPADILPDVILPQANLSSYITTEHGKSHDVITRGSTNHVTSLRY